LTQTIHKGFPKFKKLLKAISVRRYSGVSQEFLSFFVARLRVNPTFWSLWMSGGSVDAVFNGDGDVEEGTILLFVQKLLGFLEVCDIPHLVQTFQY
jgi:hypothetical protein